MVEERLRPDIDIACYSYRHARPAANYAVGVINQWLEKAGGRNAGGRQTDSGIA